jgi:hypothetical protein
MRNYRHGYAKRSAGSDRQHHSTWAAIPSHPNQSHKHLGLRMAMDGSFLDEEEHVRSDAKQLLNALAEDRVLTQKEKERVITTAVCTVFSYSAGCVAWTRAELDRISKMWTRAYKQAWKIASSTDSSPFILGQPDGGRGCPLASTLRTREALEVIEQCVCLPGEISQIVLHCLRQQCISRGCQKLNPLQLLVRISGRTKSVLGLLLLRLDEQGLDISSPWMVNGDDSIVSVLWPKLYAAWLSKERGVGCRELDEDVLSKWEQALLCLVACASLGNAEPAILSISQFQGTQTQWLRSDESANRNCHLSPLEHTALTSWLSMLETQQLEMSAAASRTPIAMEDGSGISSTLSQRSHSAVRNAENTADPYGLKQASPGTARAEAKWQDPLWCPPCIQGQICGVKPHEQLVLQCTLQSGLPEVDISTISDQ